MSRLVVRAAGGVVWRPAAAGVEILLVHRPRYDDWTLPKGKCDEGESEVDCALREVEEETGLRCELGRDLIVTRYVDGRGRPKSVRYWAMRPLDGEFVPGDEVDEVQWVAVDRAMDLLSYDRDKPVVAEFCRVVPS